ncbi:hypothetical protein [Paenibacillus ginsengihumi]|uniref:hypothetical protein n=1 Tax=Paenibacillus ginsengihumi TaxID=431596 RepID=UPI00037E5A86|nr:hypothetical protein [Paenibacillus ginsengihumi]
MGRADRCPAATGNAPGGRSVKQGVWICRIFIRLGAVQKVRAGQDTYIIAT